MSLPKLTQVKFSTTLPSGKKLEFRPFLVKEEKALLIAVQSEDQEQMLSALRDVISSCVNEEDFDINKAPFFDSEFLFLQLRAKSVGEIATLQYRHTDGVNNKGEPCETVTDININLESIKATPKEGHDNKVKITDTLFLKMRYPSIFDIASLKSAVIPEIELIAKCLEYAYDNNETYEADTLDERIDFINSMNAKQLEKVTNFFETMPRLRCSIHYKCSGCGQENDIELEGLADFFS